MAKMCVISLSLLRPIWRLHDNEERVVCCWTMYDPTRLYKLVHDYLEPLREDSSPGLLSTQHTHKHSYVLCVLRAKNLSVFPFVLSVIPLDIGNERALICPPSLPLSLIIRASHWQSCLTLISLPFLFNFTRVFEFLTLFATGSNFAEEDSQSRFFSGAF